MTPHGNHPSLFDDREGLDLTPPGEGFELYQHKDAEKMRTKSGTDTIGPDTSRSTTRRWGL